MTTTQSRPPGERTCSLCFSPISPLSVTGTCHRCRDRAWRRRKRAQAGTGDCATRQPKTDNLPGREETVQRFMRLASHRLPLFVGSRN